MSQKEKYILLACMTLISFYLCFEVFEEYLDYYGYGAPGFLKYEFVVVLICLIATAYIAYSIIQQNKKHTEIQQDLIKVKDQLEGSSIRLKEGKEKYQEVIQWQFKEWTLSPSEQEVALLILKGLSIKEISNARSTKEKTVRSQASAIYNKSNLWGRHELSAWFFEDLL